MNSVLTDQSIHHAGIKPVVHPRLKTVVNGQTAVRYMRFLRPVAIDQLELRPQVHGRWIPSVPTHPAHLIISVLDPRTGRWNTVREVDLPRDPRIEGRGLNQRMTIQQMDAHFERVLKDLKHVIRLGGLKTDHLRVECDREHPVWPNHGECNGEVELPALWAADDAGCLSYRLLEGAPARATPASSAGIGRGFIRVTGPSTAGSPITRRRVRLLAKSVSGL